MEKELKKYFLERSLISLYVNESEPSKFLVGYINAIDDDGMIISHISPYGTYDGYVYIRKEDVFRIEIGSRYMKKLEKLMLHNDRKKHESIMIQSDQSLLSSFFVFIQSHDYLIGVSFDEGAYPEIIGFIREIKEDVLIIEQITEEGEKDGVTAIKMDRIYHCESDTMDEQIIMQIL